MSQNQPTKNLILYDWLTFSCGFLCDEVLIFLGLEGLTWRKNLGSKLNYDERWEYEGISIHFAHPGTSKNSGCCVEMSGQGCRCFETFGRICFPRLLSDLIDMGANITRLDIAYDDFTGMIDIDEMFRAASAGEYVSCKKALSLSCSGRDREHLGKTVGHGDKSSTVYFRCYDKRIERNAMEFDHWVRFEIQLRKDAAMNFARAPGRLAAKFSAVLNNYLRYAIPDKDTNSSRWETAPWWLAFVDSVDSISLYTKKDLEYNRARLENWVFGQCKQAIKTAILVNGYSAFLDLLPAENELSPKYGNVIEHERQFREKLRQEEEKSRERALAAVRLGVSQGRRDEILKSICGGT